MLTVRGTLSINDALTDLTVSMEELKPEHQVPEVNDLQYVHKVIYPDTDTKPFIEFIVLSLQSVVCFF